MHFATCTAKWVLLFSSLKKNAFFQCFNFNVDYTTAKTARHICFLLMHKHKVVNNCYCATTVQETVKSSAAEMNSKVTQSLISSMVLPFDRSHVTSFYSFLLYVYLVPKYFTFSQNWQMLRESKLLLCTMPTMPSPLKCFTRCRQSKIISALMPPMKTNATECLWPAQQHTLCFLILFYQPW